MRVRPVRDPTADTRPTPTRPSHPRTRVASRVTRHRHAEETRKADASPRTRASARAHTPRVPTRVASETSHSIRPVGHRSRSARAADIARCTHTAVTTAATTVPACYRPQCCLAFITSCCCTWVEHSSLFSSPRDSLASFAPCSHCSLGSRDSFPQSNRLPAIRTSRNDAIRTATRGACGKWERQQVAS